MKLYPFLHCAVMLLFFSCNKTCLVTPEPEQQILSVNSVESLDDPIKPNTNVVIPVIDTVIPANAVNVKTLGLIGNGITDDSDAFQAALNSQTTLMLPKGTYIINKTLNVKANTKIYGVTGATIKTGINMKGTLLTHGRFFYLNNASNCSINNVKFQQSLQSFKFDKWSSACIYLENSANTQVTYNFFDFNLPYSNTGYVAVWVGGSGTRNTLIKANRLISAGIEYAENGAGGTLVDGNYISNSPKNGLVAHGNTTDACTGNVLVNNLIENVGYMGIEDWGNVDGTIIRNNTIKGTGKNPSNLDAIGISAVGRNTHVVSNSIADAIFYYIEVAGSHNLLVDSNTINDSRKKAMGIMVNFTDAPPAGFVSKNTIIKNNNINNCDKGIAIEGDNLPNVEIIANNIVNPGFEGINVNTASPENFAIHIESNNIQFNTPNTKERKAVELYSSLPHGQGNQNITLLNNYITYATTATGGPGVELGIEVGIDNTVLDGNTINGNNIKGAKQPVRGVTANGASTQNVTLVNNMITGALADLNFFTFKNKSGNNF